MNKEVDSKTTKQKKTKQKKKKKKKKDKLDFIRKKNICASKKRIKKVKRQSRELKKIFSNYFSDKGFLFKKYKEFL